ncbi:hypothetical protein [Arcanobacterium phocae]|nr:hypothetical protein [Arcanobacterium phocae]
MRSDKLRQLFSRPNLARGRWEMIAFIDKHKDRFACSVSCA